MLDPVSIIAIGASAISIIFLVKWGFSVDDKVEELRKDAFRAGGALRKMGFEWVDDLLECIASGDKTGAVKAVKELRKKMDDPAVFHDHMQAVFLKGLPYLMDDDKEFYDKVFEVVKNKRTVEEAERAAEREIQDALEAARLAKANEERAAKEALEAKRADG